jgi:2'-5' RNA ligase
MIEKWRCFLAVTPTSEIGRNVRELVRELDPLCKEAGQKVRWVHPSKVHLTLRFLGDLPVPLALALEDALRELDATRRFEVTFASLGAFPDPGHPRVVWMGVEDGGEELGRLHEHVSTLLEREGIPRDERPFSPHVTLGRVRRPGRADLGPVLEGYADRTFGTMQVRRVIFYRSILESSGAVHEPKWSVELGREGRGT